MELSQLTLSQIKKAHIRAEIKRKQNYLLRILNVQSRAYVAGDAVRRYSPGEKSVKVSVYQKSGELPQNRK